MSKTRRYSASVACSRGPFHSTPALLNATSSRPNLSTVKINHRFHVGIFRHVHAEERRIAAEFFNFGNDLRAFFFPAPSQNDIRACASKLDCGGLTDAGGTSGYECNFA